MQSMFQKRLMLAACFLAVAACDAKPAEAPAPAPAAEAAVAVPPAPLTATAIVAAMDKGSVCQLFGAAISTAAKKIQWKGCAATPGETDIAFATHDGAVTLTVPVVHDGTVVQVAAANASPAAVENTTQGGWDNIGMVFVGEAPAAKSLCMTVDYFAPSGASNSLFVTPLGGAAKAFGLATSPNDWMKKTYEEPVLQAGKSGAFALTRREVGTLVKQVSFAACP